nr:MAG TPA_asm: hypothetical protein [Caudoviricetes sp.]
MSSRGSWSNLEEDLAYSWVLFFCAKIHTCAQVSVCCII